MVSQVLRILQRCGDSTTGPCLTVLKVIFICLTILSVLIFSHEVSCTINKLADNKASGLDHITAGHIKYASMRLAPLLGIRFNSFLIHGFLLDTMISVLLVPVIKDKSGKVGCSDNYRPIALANVLS